MSEFTGIEDASVPTIQFEVPGGYVTQVRSDGGEERLVSLYKLHARELGGEEEDILAEEDTPTTVKFHKIVSSCLLSISDDEGNVVKDPKVLVKASDRLLMSDLLIGILRVRQCTVGNNLQWPVDCPECESVDPKSGSAIPTKITVLFNLDDLEIKPLEGDRTVRLREFTTSRGAKVTWEMLNGSMERELMKVRGRVKDKATAGMLVRLRTVNGEPATMKNVKALSFVERGEIRDKYLKSEGDIVRDVKALCHRCGANFKTPIRITGDNFFDLSGMLEG